MILGIDEAGRGPWAGPLVVGAVVLGGAQIDGLTDSKKLSKKKREALYDEVTRQAVAYASGWVSAGELDEIGMSAALRLATRRVVEQIDAPYSEIIIDGTVNFLADTGKGEYVQTMPKADLLIPSVSAASIIAKVERDRYMTKLGEKYPEYGFGAHAGYGVAKHRAAIEEYGVISEHRLSFAPLQKYGKDGSPVSVTKSDKTASRRASLAYAAGETWAADVLLDLSQNSSTAMTTKSIGNRAEDVVANFLQSEGHEILERNWRTKFCEIDIISRHNQTVYFTEVKYRKNARHGDGLAAVTTKKQRQMRFAAELYMARLPDDIQGVLAAASVSGGGFALDEWIKIV